ncbi:MAG: hypothetical protein KY475_06280, partial [Planctomycetes bacterium]|nr:hypothetical protein [Planctomycetota bacterium]
MDSTQRILVIDDNPDIHRDFRKVLAWELNHDRELQDLSAELFGDSPAEVDEAPDCPVLEIDSAFQGEQGIEMALDAAQRGRPYLMAFVDVRMPPGIDGVQTIKRMWDQLPELQCVICTAYSDYEWEDLCGELNSPANLLILKKPFDTVEVLQVVRALAEKAELARQARSYQQALEQKIQHLTRVEAELRQNNEELRTARAAADESNRTKSEFLANVSHELRTPLNGVIGMSDLLLATNLDQNQRKFASTVKTSGELLLDLLNEILDFSKIEAGKLELEDIGFDLLEMIETVVQVVGHKCQQKGLELSYFLDPDVPRSLRGDPNRVRQILMNLTNNAVKFTDKGEVIVQVSREEASPGRCTICFSVSDTGVGIPLDRRDRLFQSFSQVDASTTRKYGGTGLGLAISKELCVRMGGE